MLPIFQSWLRKEAVAETKLASPEGNTRVKYDSVLDQKSNSGKNVRLI